MDKRHIFCKNIPLLIILLTLFYVKISSQENKSVPDNKTVSENKSAPDNKSVPDTKTVSDNKSKPDNESVPDFEIKPDKVLLIIIKPGKIIDEFQSSSEIYKTMYLSPGTATIIPGTKANTTNTFKAGTIHYILDPEDAESQKYLGDALFKKGEKASATRAYRTALKLDPEIKGVYKNYSVLLAETGKPDNVIKILNKVIEKGEADNNTYLALGTLYQRKNNHKKAVEIFTQILKDNPDDFSTLNALAVSKEKSGDISGAIADLKLAISLNKNARDEFEFLGRLYTKKDSIDEAMQAFISFLDNEGKNQTIALKVGTYLFKKDNFKEAKKYLDMVKGSASKTASYLNMAGNCAFNDGEYKDAIDKFKLSNSKKKAPLEIRKDNFKKLAESNLKLKNNKAALTYFNRFAQINKTKDKDVSYLRAYLNEESNPTMARTLYEANLKAFPEDHRNYLQLGILLSKNKKALSRSVSLLKKAAEVVDTIPAVWLQIAEAYGKLNKPDEELDAYKKLIALDPDNVEVNVRIGKLLIKEEKISEGITYLRTANKADPKNGEVILFLSDIYIKENRKDEALNLLDGSKETHKDNINIQKKLVDVLVLLDKDQALVAQLKKVLELERDNETLMLYAELLFKTGQMEEAKNACEDILSTDPESIETLMIMGAILKKEQKYTEANDVYSEINIIDNQYVAAFYERGDLFLLQSKPLWAEKYFKKALAINPDFGLANLGLAKVALLHKDKNKYKELVETAYSLDPNNEQIKKEYEKIK